MKFTDTLLESLSDPPKRPVYRTKGKFRKETHDEFRTRLGEFRYCQHLRNLELLKVIASTNPYAELMK